MRAHTNSGLKQKRSNLGFPACGRELRRPDGHRKHEGKRAARSLGLTGLYATTDMAELADYWRSNCDQCIVDEVQK
jgi:hypothetical protein